jgi:putative endonuclease
MPAFAGMTRGGFGGFDRHGRACPGHPRLCHSEKRRGCPAFAGHDGGGLVPAIHVFMLRVMERGGFVYFMTNRRNGIIYVGVTSNLLARVYQHREGLVEGFTKRYGLKLLVYYEQFDDIRDAIAREKAIKHWLRAWKVRLIHEMNPQWDDLYAALTP